jgi:DNA invertase Pin-like site-specific DNA recombinase
MVRDLNERGIIIDIGNIGRVDNTPIGKFTVLMLLAIAEFEKDQILERFADGKRIARSQGRKTDGRNKIPTPLDQLKELYALQQSGEVTVAEASKRMGLSRSVWYTRVRDMVSGSAVGA